MVQKKKLSINIVCSLLLQACVFASGIILPRLFIGEYGSKVNGLVSGIQQFLGFISFGELGIGAVIQYNLYKPLADKDWKSVSNIVKSAKRFFNRLLIVILIYITLLALLFPLRTKGEFDYLFTLTLVLAISFSYIMQYYFGMAYRQLLDANQLSFVRIIPQIFQIIINVVVCSMLIRAHTDVRLVKLTTSLLYSIQPLAIFLFTKIHYKHLDLTKPIVGEPIKQKWNGIAQHLAAVVLKDTDIVVLTLLSTLENVSIYAVYNLVINGIEVLIESVVSNLTAVFGELYAKREGDSLDTFFDKFELIYHFAIAIIFFCVGRLIVPFVTVYTNGITDANYIVPVFAVIISVAQWLYCARLPYHLMVKAAGHYKQTQNSAIVEASINVVVSVLSVRQFGLVGVAIGTAAAMFYRTIYYCIYLKKNILVRPISKAVKIYLCDLLLFVSCWLVTSRFSLIEISYVSWFLMALKVFSIALLCAFLIFGTLYSRQLKNMKFNIRKRSN